MTPYDALLITGTIQGMMLTLALWVKNYRKKHLNAYFFMLIGCISIGLLCKYLYSVSRFQAHPQAWFLIDLLSYGIGPLWYLTIQKSIHPHVSFSWKEWLALSPILYQLGFQTYFLTLDSTQFLNWTATAEYAIYFYVFCFTVVIVNGYFIGLAHIIIVHYRNVQFPRLLIRGQYAFSAILAIWVIAFVLSFILANAYMVNQIAYALAFVSFAFLTFSLAFLALVNPASFHFLTQVFDHSETFVLQQIATKVQRFIKEEHPYLKPNFSLSELSEAVQANPVLTSKAINRILNTSYSDLMNQNRVQYFIKLAKEDTRSHLTLWAIAQEAGFGNKVTFYKAFKKIMGTTPKLYLSSEH